MSLITYNGLVELVANNVLTPVPLENINGASIDVRLGRFLWFESTRGGRVDLSRKETYRSEQFDLRVAPFSLSPGEFVLAQTLETFNLPNDIAAEFRLKSSSARAGLDQALAVWCDPGWHGSVLTLELRNNLQHHMLMLTEGMKIGQVVFMRGEPVPDHASYATRGQYNGDQTAQPSRGLR